MSQSALDLIAKEKIEKTGILDLRNCGLTEIPEEVFELEWLTFLNCPSNLNTYEQINQITKIPKKINKLTKLIYLNLGNEVIEYQIGNKITDISPIQNLKNLSILILKGNSVQDISYLNDLTSLKYLDISELQGSLEKRIPSRLENLKDLKVLKVTVVDMFNFALFEKLKTLHITYWFCYNCIEDLSFIRKMVNLEDLLINYINLGFDDEDYSEHATEYREKGKFKDLNFIKSLTNLKKLSLTNHLIEDTEVLKKFPNLESLDLSNNPIKNTNGLKELIQLKELKLNNCKLFYSVGFITKSKSLQRLELNNNYISHIQPLKELSLLEFIEIENNNITDISVIENFKELKLLKAGNNKIVNIEGLKNLDKIKNLYLENNQITDITSIINLIEITILDLSNNQIIDISSLSNLDKMFKLNLNQNNIENIDNLKNLTQLWKLNLSHNSIVNIDSLENLNGLVFLHLNNNKIKKIEAIKKLYGLFQLDLSNNKIIDVSPLNLGKASKIDLSNNQIKRISLNFFKKHPSLGILQLDNNPIEEIPPEIYDNRNISNWKKVKKYLEDSEQGKSKINDYKVILIGNGSVGKTQIANRLSKRSFNKEHNSTHAIALLKSKIKDINLNIWDFAGQDIYHSTHRLFMKTRAIFLLVWDFENEYEKTYHIYGNKKYKNETLDYWLEYANHYSSGNPIIIVQNKTDKKRYEFDKDGIKKLKDTYPQIIIYKDKFIDVTAKDNKGFSRLKKALEISIKENSLLSKSQYLPDLWIKVRYKLEELRNQERKTLSYEEYETIFHDDKESCSTIIEYLHDIGEVYYQAGYFNNEIILNQSWAIEAIYKILDRESDYFENLEGNGKLEYEDLVDFWSNYTDNEKELLIGFMLNTELCFETSDYSEDSFLELKDRTFSIPQFFEEEKPGRVQSLEKSELITNIIEYRFLPAIFIYRFISRASRVFKDAIPWKHGILIRENNELAIIEAIYEEKAIVIKATNENFVKKIKEELDIIVNESNITISKGEIPLEERDYINYKKEQRKGLKSYNDEIGRSYNSKFKEDFELLEKRVTSKIETNEINIINNSNKNKVEIIEKVNEGFQKMVLKFDEIQQDIKTKKIDIEQAVVMLLKAIDAIEIADTETYKIMLHRWLPNSDKLYGDGKYLLTQAEFLYDITRKTKGNDDYSASILQYCRAIENEFKNLFSEYRKYLQNPLNEKKIDDLIIGDNGHNNFAEYISKPSPTLDFGEMITILELLNDKIVQDTSNEKSYPLFIDFGEFLETEFDILILLKEDYPFEVNHFKNLINEYYDDIRSRKNELMIKRWVDKDDFHSSFSNFIQNKTTIEFKALFQILNNFDKYKVKSIGKNGSSDKFSLFDDFCEFLSKKDFIIQREDGLLKLTTFLKDNYRNNVAHPNDIKFDKEQTDNDFIPKAQFILKGLVEAKRN